MSEAVGGADDILLLGKKNPRDGAGLRKQEDKRNVKDFGNLTDDPAQSEQLGASLSWVSRALSA